MNARLQMTVDRFEQRHGFRINTPEDAHYVVTKRWSDLLGMPNCGRAAMSLLCEYAGLPPLKNYKDVNRFIRQREHEARHYPELPVAVNNALSWLDPAPTTRKELRDILVKNPEAISRMPNIGKGRFDEILAYVGLSRDDLPVRKREPRVKPLPEKPNLEQILKFAQCDREELIGIAMGQIHR